MFIITEEQALEFEAIADVSQRKFEVAKHLASLGLHVFPARPYDETAFYSAKSEYDEAKAARAAGNTDAPKIDQKHYKQHGGKAPAFGNQYAKATVSQPTIESWWHPTTGKYRGNNVCLMTGEKSGVVVIDLDVKPDEGVDGMAWWSALVTKYEPVDTFMVVSGGESKGGRHIYFKWRPGVRRRDGHAPGVDIRSDDSHIMAPFSICQGTYDPVVFDEVAEMPDWLFDELTREPEKRTKTSARGKVATRTAESNEDTAAEVPATPLDQIAEMLSFIDPVEHEEWWSKICFAIRAEHPGEDGFAVLDDWSKRDPSEYDYASNLDFWKRATPQKSGGATISTLYHYAELCGWVNPKRGATYLDVSRAVRMMNRSFAIIDPDRYMVNLARMGKTFDPSVLPPNHYPPMVMFKTKTVLSEDVVPLVHEYGKVTEISPDQMNQMAVGYKVLQELPGGKAKVSSMREVWMASAARKSYAAAGYYVNDEQTPEGVLNLFPGWAMRPKEGHPEKFVNHVRDILCRGDEERAYWIFNRLAYMIQYGNEVVPTSLVITGAQGAGKSIIGDYLERMIGTLNYKYLHDAEALKTRFSEELVGKFVIVADEAIFAGDPQLRNKLKSMIAAKNLREEGKGKAAKDAQNVMFLIVFSNEDEPVGIEPGDRRFSVMKPDDRYSYDNCKRDPEVKKMATKYFNELVKEMRGDGPAKLLHMLLNWDVDKNAARIPLDTEEKQDMQESRTLKTDSLTAYIYYLWSVGYGDDSQDDPNPSEERWGGRVRTGKLYEDYGEWVKTQKAHHRNSEWRAEPLNKFVDRLVEEFGATVVRPSGRSTIVWPKEEAIIGYLKDKVPQVMNKNQAQIEEDF